MKKLYLICLIFILFPLLPSAHPAWGILVDKNRNVYFADIVHNGRGSVWKLSSNGELELLLSDFHAHNVNLDSKGYLVTAHGEGNHTMVRLLPHGKIDTLITTQDIYAFFGGNCTYSPSGEILFSIDNYIWIIDKEGKKRKASEHKFTWTQTICADEDGSIYAPDIGVGNGSLVKIDPNGKAETIATNLYSELDRPIDQHQDVLLGITKGCDNLIYIAETAGQRIIKVLEDGSTETFYRSDGDWFPCGIDFIAGDAYILESRFGKKGLEGPRITKLDEQGNKTILFEYGKERGKRDALPTKKQETGPLNKGKGLFVLGILPALICLVAIGLLARKWSKRVKSHQKTGE